MKKTIFILSLLCSILFCSCIGTVFGAGAGAAVFAASLFVETPAGATLVGVTPEIWTSYIVGNIFKDNEFLLESIDESQYVLNGSVVHIPQAGAPSGVKRNRTLLPATVKRRSDTDVTYALDEFTTDPRYIPDADKIELSYDLMDSCMSEDMSALKEVLADSILYNWRPKYYIKASKPKNADYTIVGTGLRTGLCVDDFSKAKQIFDKWGIPKNDRKVLLSTEMYEQICADVRKSTNENLSAVYDHVNGRLRRLEGFDIIERQTVLMASNSLLTSVPKTSYFKWTGSDLNYTPEDYMDILAGDKNIDNTACSIGLFWHKNFVRRALGVTKMFNNDGDPTYYGDIYSFLQKGGGRMSRGDGKGVLGVIQEYSAS